MRLRHLAAALLGLVTVLHAPVARAAGALTSGTTVAGTIAGPTFLESWTFSGTTGQLVVVSAATTSGTLNTTIVLKAPGGATVANSSGADRLEYQLLVTGTFTLQIQDVGVSQSGGYALGFTNITAGPLTSAADPNGGAIVSSDVVSGTTSGPADFDAWTFSGTTGQRILIGGVATAGAGYDTNLLLYPPGGGVAVSNSFTGDILNYQLTATGTWTIVLEDYSNDAAGGYNLTFLNVTAGPFTNGADPDGGAILSSGIKAGSFQAPGDFDAWTFTGAPSQLALLAAVSTGAGTHDTAVYLFPPNGASATINTATDRSEQAMAAAGTWTIVVYENGLNQTGTYSLGYLNGTVGPFTNGADPNGGPIVSSDLVSGTTSGVADFDAWTFSGTTGQRILISGVATAGAGYDTNLLLYPPGGGIPVANSFTGDILNYQLTATGTWTIVLEDYDNNVGGSYNLSFLNVTAGPFTNGADPDGGPILSSDIKAGSFQAPGDFDAWTFTGAPSQLALLAAVSTGAGTHDTSLYLFPPNGASATVNTATDRIDQPMAVAGTWTIVVYENGLNQTGSYSLGYLNGTVGPYTNGADTNGGPIVSSDVVSGTTSGVADFDAWTFSGTAGQRILISGVATAGAGYDTNLLLYPPGGGAALTSTFTGDILNYQLTATGTWTIVLEDYDNNVGGSYNLSFLNVTAGPFTNGADADGGAILSSDTKAGSFQAPGDFDAWTFAGAPSQLALLAAVSTGAGTHDTAVYLFPPNGAGATVNTATDRIDQPMAVAGTWTIVVYENGLNQTGSYSLGYLNGTVGPYTNGGDTNGGPIVSSDVVSGTTSGVADFDAWTFSGTAGQRVLIGGVATAGVGYDTNLLLYPPGGGAALTSTFTGDILNYQLTATGTWTIVLEDYGNDAAGSYNLSFLNVTAGPFTNGADPDGGPIVSNDTKTGSFQAPGDFDAWTFSGAPGQLALLAAVATGAGTHDTAVYLFPPNGAAALVNTATDRSELAMAVAGTWTIVVYENGLNQTGGYALGFLNATTGPYTSGTDTSGGQIASNETRTGVLNGPADFDGYRFTGTRNDRILITAVTTGGAANTNIIIYPPNGGAGLLNSFTGDRMDFQLTMTGSWTFVIEDFGSVAAGNYSLGFLNVTGGPLNTNGDVGSVATGVPVTAAMDQVGDLDGYAFYGTSGQSASITATTLTGAMDTQIVLYPPGGGPALQNTVTDTFVQLLPTSGYYRIVIEDSADNQTGTYRLTLTGTGAVSGLPETPFQLPDGRRALLLPAAPSPFRQTTQLAFHLRNEAPVLLRVFSAGGALVRTLVDRPLAPGRHEAAWDGRDERGASVGSGVYYLQLLADGENVRQKVVRVR